QVLLEWEAAANNGSPIAHYEIQWRPVSDPAQPWSIWAEVSGGRSARDTTMTGLTNGQRYEFAVRAVNGVGDGASIAQTAMPQALSLTASGGDGQVGLNWTFSAHSSTIAHYQVRQRISDSGQAWSDWATVPGGTTARDTTVTGLTNGETYQFQAQAIDSQDASVSVSAIVSATPAAVPDAPPHFMPFPGDSQVLLEWEAAANNGSPITHYEIQWRPVSDPAQPWSDWVPVSGGRSARDTTVTGLTNRQRYEFAVRAVNGVGEGASIAQTAMPQALSLTASGGDGQVGLRWTFSAHSSTIAHYQVRQRISDSGQAWSDWATVPGGTTARDTTVTGLTNGVTYQFQAQAIDSQAASVSVSAIVSATPVGVPGAPEISVEGLDGILRFHIRLTAENGSPITRVERRISHIHGQPVQPESWDRFGINPRRASYPVLFTKGYPRYWFGLTNGTRYTFAFRAVNAVGAGAITSVEATAAAIPDAPPLTATAGDGQVVLGWTAAANNGAPIEQYRVWWQPSKDSSVDASRWAVVPGDSTARDTTITGLTNGTSYRFGVRAFNRVGGGRIGFATATPQPGTFSLQASAGDGQVGLRWTAPANDAAVAGYALQWRVSDAGQDWSPWSAVSEGAAARATTVGGLTNEVTYQLAVRAVDSAGQPVAVSNIVSATPAAPSVTTFRFVPPRRMERATVGLQYLFNRPNATDGTGTITYATTSTGGGLTATRTGLAGTPTAAGRFDFTWTATDGTGATAIFTLTLTIRTPDSPPAFDEDRVAYTVQAGSTFNETLPDAEGADRYETVGTVPGYVTVHPTTRAIEIRPENTHVGSDRFTFRAHNTHGTDDLTVDLTVSAVPTDPGDRSPWYYQLAASRPDTPARQTSPRVSPPTGWQTNNPGATAQAGVWRTRATRASNPSEWVFLTPTLFQSQTHASRLPKPTGLNETSVDDDSARLNWTAVAGAGSYQVRYRVDGSTAAWNTAPVVHTFLDIFRLSGDTTYEWAVRALADDSDETNSEWTAASFTTLTAPPALGDTEYAYRASQLAPLFDAVASGTPDHWSSGAITWTDAAPRVWSIRRTRPSGGSWSEWGTLEKYSQRPAAPLIFFYRRAVNNPGAPLSTTASATPSTWEASNPGATATLNVWQTQRSRPTGDTHYQFTTPVIVAFATGTPPPETEYAYRLHTSGTTAPSFIASSSTIPSGWYSSRQTPTSTASYEWQISRTRPAGGSWSSWSGARVVSTYTARQYAYRLGTSY
ncbi:MAG: fibronectin type III domain-containing protein, partial [Gemmatimonadota bacterium]|nr:fibronectin type III domain-containing protein [Gemmatimonadota bacterium]